MVVKSGFSSFLILTFCLLAGGAEAQEQRNKICISTRDIVRSEPQDGGSSIVFTMRDGTVWRNDLHGRCGDLTFNGFVWILRNPDQTVCEDEQSLRVIRSGQVCQLGKFSRVQER